MEKAKSIKSIVGYKLQISTKCFAVGDGTIEVQHKSKSTLSLKGEQEWCVRVGKLDAVETAFGQGGICHFQA